MQQTFQMLHPCLPLKIRYAYVEHSYWVFVHELFESELLQTISYH